MIRSIRALATLTIFVAVTAQAPAPIVNGELDFCTRFGKNLGLDEKTLVDGKGSWRAHALTFAQRFIWGSDEVTTSLTVRPIEPATVEEYKRISEMCRAFGEGAVCHLVGPAEFTFVWKGITTVTPLLLDERAVVRIEGQKTICESRATVQK